MTDMRGEPGNFDKKAEENNRHVGAIGTVWRYREADTRCKRKKGPCCILIYLTAGEVTYSRPRTLYTARVQERAGMTGRVRTSWYHVMNIQFTVNYKSMSSSKLCCLLQHRHSEILNYVSTRLSCPVSLFSLVRFKVLSETGKPQLTKSVLASSLQSHQMIETLVT
jgi:hypothetical protein